MRIRPLAQRSGGLFTAGALWIFMPCGLLWSALLVASLSGGPVQGAISMALFGAASSTGLLFGPWLFAQLKQAGNRLRQDWGTRAAGVLLAGAAGLGAVDGPGGTHRHLVRVTPAFPHLLAVVFPA